MHMGSKTPISGWQLFMFALIFGLIGGIVGWAAFAAPHNGGGGGKGGKGTSYTASFVGSNPVMVTDNNGNGLPNYGDTITFNVTSTAPYYGVKVICYQNSVQVWTQTQGFYPGWLWGHDYVLSGGSWTSGAANCTATLFSQNADGSNTQNYATINFSVDS